MSVIKAPLRNRAKPSRKKIDYEKIERAHSILRGKRIQRSRFSGRCGMVGSEVFC